MIYESILHTIGRTPIVRVHRSALAHVEMYVKCEYFNPLSSVRDRLAIAIIEDAERSGELKPGQTVVEATSGNTGIALAMVCAAKGYPFVALMVETFSVEEGRHALHMQSHDIRELNRTLQIAQRRAIAAIFGAGLLIAAAVLYALEAGGPRLAGVPASAWIAAAGGVRALVAAWPRRS